MSLLHDPAFTAAPVPTCAGACPAPHQVCQCEGRACPPIPRPHPGPGAEQRLRQGSTVDLALASKGTRGRLPSPREACGLALVWGREVTVTVGLLKPLLCAAAFRRHTMAHAFHRCGRKGHTSTAEAKNCGQTAGVMQTPAPWGQWRWAERTGPEADSSTCTWLRAS